MALVDEYNRGWALRYIREARAELTSARNIPFMAQSLVAEAVKKALEAVYHSLGNPSSIRMIVGDIISEGVEPEDPLLRWLIEFERATQEVANIPSVSEAIRVAEELVEEASEVVRILAASEEKE